MNGQCTQKNEHKKRAGETTTVVVVLIGGAIVVAISDPKVVRVVVPIAPTQNTVT
jgi:hypothetical protein